MANDLIQTASQQIDRALAARDSADISWIQPPPMRDGWTLAADALQFLDCLVRDLKPKHVLEFGAGLSTKVLARACVQMGTACAISSIDHDPEFGVSDTRTLVESAKNLTLASQISPLVARDYGGKLLPTYYFDSKKFATTAPADLVLIDGPPVNLGGREGILYQAMEFCRPGTIVLLDDANRGAERIAARDWQEVLGDAIEVRHLPHFTKGMAAVIVHKMVKLDQLWNLRWAGAKKQIENLTAAKDAFVLVESKNWDDFADGRHALPLVKRGDEDWGAPENDQIAMAELESRRSEGATHFILPWTSFWWVDCYGAFFSELRRRFNCVADGDLLLAFDLRKTP
ncbi:MAG TPA: hypothetical protein VHS31_04820 [Tepidisphaeraceae bacterium]|jgi:predicted O-methyltransferase YrrM|nr:hypothetical protein [Tepidisphaeraceae bacterium]